MFNYGVNKTLYNSVYIINKECVEQNRQEMDGKLGIHLFY
jgi:hypothetical protein